MFTPPKALSIRLITSRIILYIILIYSSTIFADQPVRPDFLQQVYGYGVPYLFVEKIWVEHDTHKMVEPWWEVGTEWECRPAMMVYCRIYTRFLKDKEINVVISLQDEKGNKVRWAGKSGFHWTAKDGTLKAWWTDRPPLDDFTYEAFRIPIPYEAIDALSINSTNLTIMAEVWADGVKTSAQAQVESNLLKQKAIPAGALQTLTILADKFGEIHANLELIEVAVQPANMSVSDRFSLITRYMVTDKTTQAYLMCQHFSGQLTRLI